jgi:pimeloyl-ACP methyl ester carboxylesterase
VPDTQLFELVDRRELAWIEYGRPEGVPVVVLHGSPGTGRLFASQSDCAAAAGVRMVAPDRPGYGHSTYQPGRSYAQWAHDVGQLTDHLGLDRFAVLGHSSGGPNAAACARFLGARLLGCAIVSGPAPPDARVSTRETSRFNRVFQRLALAAPRSTGVLYGAGLRAAQREPARALEWMRRTLPPCDVEVLMRPEVRDGVRDDVARPLYAAGARAAVQDTWLEGRPWGFRLEDIEMPVHVWHGDADRNVVVGNGIVQADLIPNAVFHRLPAEGHWLVFDHFEEILGSIGA